jgi:hypothetical protein
VESEVVATYLVLHVNNECVYACWRRNLTISLLGEGGREGGGRERERGKERALFRPT